MIIYIKLVDGVKTDAHEGNSGQHLFFFLNGLKISEFIN